MTFEEKVAFALRKMDEKIDCVNKNIKEQFATFAGVIEIINRVMDEMEKAHDLDRARISKLESILPGHEVSLIDLGADPRPVEDQAVSETPFNAPVAAVPDETQLMSNAYAGG
jgi:hypothetical protein